MERARETEKQSQRRAAHAPIDWRPVTASGHQIIDWAVDIALRQVDGLDSDQAIVDRVRKTLHEAFDGKPPTGADSQRELLFVMGLFLAEVELDCGVPGIRAAVYEALDALTPTASAERMRGFIAHQVWPLMPRWPVHCGCCPAATS